MIWKKNDQYATKKSPSYLLQIGWQKYFFFVMAGTSNKFLSVKVVCAVWEEGK